MNPASIVEHSTLVIFRQPEMDCNIRARFIPVRAAPRAAHPAYMPRWRRSWNNKKGINKTGENAYERVLSRCKREDRRPLGRKRLGMGHTHHARTIPCGSRRRLEHRAHTDEARATG